MKNKHLAMITMVIFIGALALSFLSCDDGGGGGGNGLSATVTLPLLPIDLPILPTDVTLDGMVESIEEAIEDALGSWAVPSEGAISDFIEEVEEKLAEASLEILQFGVLSASIDSIITDVIRAGVKVTEVGVNFEFENTTDTWVDVPVEFQLYLGDGELAEAWDESVMIPFADPRVDEDGKFIVAPGETIDLSVENVPHLVDALNNSDSIGIGYKALYRLADMENGADPIEAIKEFGVCLISGLIAGNTSGCPDVEELLQWHLTLKKFELVITAEANLEIPEIPGCDEFASEYNLDLLQEACPDGDSN